MPRSSSRALLPASLTLGLILGITGATAASAAALAATSDPTPRTAVSSLSLTQPLDDIEREGRQALAVARSALGVTADSSAAVTASGLDLDVDTTIDTTQLRALIDQLEVLDVTPTLLLPDITAATVDETARVLADARSLRTALSAAEEEQAAEQAAAEAAERAAEAARVAAEHAEAVARAAADNSVEGAQATARQLASAQFGWGEDQFSCLVSLWDRESGWNYQAYNASSGATGIPQALPGSKMASAGSDWQTSAATQIAWGLGYISSVYATPCGAWSHSQSTGWY